MTKKKSKHVSFALNNESQKRIMRRYSPVFLFPTVIAFLIGFVWPFLWGIYLSFFRFKTLGNTVFTAFDNYKSALTDPSFLNSFWFTVGFTVVSVIIVNLAAFLIAVALTKGIRGSSAFRTVFFVPNLIGGIVLGYIWKVILNGILLKYFDSTLSLNSTYGFIGLVILVSWQQIGYMMIIYIAGLQNVPLELGEAAKIDGAGPFQVLRFITIPSIMPSITICTFLTLTNSFKLFDQNLALTAGEPAHKTEMLALNIYKSFYESTTNMGVGQAKAVVFFIVVVIIALTQLYFTRRKEVQQ
ncbi:MAG: sugar ABC transporter permease [Clostridiales bacterium]|nr:sugar ABC transporter permease [Candidatus Equinaster intestinalis]